MTKQEIFNQVWTHFVINEGPASYRLDDRNVALCLYRGCGGARCAIGLLLSDEALDRTSIALTLSVEDLIREFLHHSDADALQELGFVKTDLVRTWTGMENGEADCDYPTRFYEWQEFLTKLQSTHDDACDEAHSTDGELAALTPFHKGIRARLEMFARDEQLTLPA